MGVFLVYFLKLAGLANDAVSFKQTVAFVDRASIFYINILGLKSLSGRNQDIASLL